MPVARPPLTTPRTTLIEATIPFLRAFVDGDRITAARAIGVAIPEDWPGSHEASAGLPIHLAAVERDPRELPWRVRLVVVAGVVVGAVNLKGPPDEHDDVEIGWGLVPSARHKGYATEAARAVIDWVFTTSTVRRVIATIAPEHERSQHVALRLGMEPVRELRNGLPVWSRLRGR